MQSSISNYTQYHNMLSLQSNEMNKASKISIIGAGISGLALSIALKQLGFTQISIFQKDVSFDCRRQGYGLTILQAKSALRKIGVLEEAKKWNAPSKAHYIFKANGQLLGFYGTLFWDHKNNNRSLKSMEKGLSMHIPRQALRRILLDRFQELSQTPVKWGSNLQSIEFGKSSALLNFGDSQQQAKLIIGCDGIFSSVRKAAVLKESPLNYLGVVVVLGLCKSSHVLNQNRVFQTADGEFRLFSMPFLPNDPELGSMWQLSFKIDEKTAYFYSQNSGQLKRFITGKLSSWHQPIPEMIDSTKKENIMVIPAFDRDPSLPQLKDKRVVLIGDALHPMSPFKGQGANQALIDAVQLAQHLSNRHLSDLGSILSSISQRASQKVIQSRQRVTKYHQKSFTESQNFLYPGIDKHLLSLLKTSIFPSQNPQQKILKIMRAHKYI